MSRLSKESAFCSVASTSQEGLEEEAPTSASNRALRVTVPHKSLSENRPVSTEKDKRPLPLFDNQPSKRLRGELTDHEVSPGSVGFLPSSVEHGQLPSSVTRQSHKGHDYQRRHNQKLLGQMFENLQQMQHDIGNVCSKDALSAKLERIASEKGFVISDNEGSGNCMFYALSEQLHLVKGITISHEKLRQVIVQYLRKNPKLPDGTDLFNFINGYRSWADYLTDMEQDGTWGDHVILYAVANCFETYIHVISSQFDHHDLTISPHCHVISTNPLVLGHVHEVHYLSLKPKQGDDKAQGGSVAEDESVQTRHDADKVVLNKEATAVFAGSVGSLPSSVEHSQLPSLTSQSHEDRNFQRGHIQSV